VTACADKEALLQGLLDGELDAANAAAMEAHVQLCAGCAAELARLESLRRLLRAPGVGFRAPEDLRARIEAELDAAALPTAPAPLPRRRPPRWLPGAGLAALAATLVLGVAVLAPRPEQLALEDQVVSGHIRSLQASHLTDVATSDRHTVKPWFNGRIDFAPPVQDLAAQGFPLAGGRLDYLHDREVAALVYRRRLHVINVFVWPARAGEAPAGNARLHGYSVSWWTRGGLEFWAVSDIDLRELQQFRQAFQAAGGPA
jgi:anti-sigma factor RsiW